MKLLIFLSVLVVGTLCLKEKRLNINQSNETFEKEIIFVGNYSASEERPLLSGKYGSYDQPSCSKHHHPLTPGLKLMSQGVDLLFLDMFPPPNDNNKKRTNAFRRPIFAFTCNPEKSWIHPTTNRQYTLPEQVETLRMLPTGQLDTTVEVQNSLQSIQQSLEAQAKLSVKLLWFGFTKSATYTLTKTNLIDKKRSVAFVSTLAATTTNNFIN